MKIGNTNLFVELKGYLKETEKVSKGKVTGGEKTDAASSTDTVSLSSKARDTEKARKVIDTSGDIREEKVQTIKRTIDEGKYSVDGDTIASNIIESALIDALL
jgi:flagellar biosynthesis anti-sigma factor FlgM